MDSSQCGRHLHDHGHQRGQSSRVGFHHRDHQRSSDQDATREPACLHGQQHIAIGQRQLYGQLSVEFQRDANSGSNERDLRHFGVTSANAGNYSVTVTSAIGSVTSSVAAVAVGSTITVNPTSASLHPTQVGTFSVGAQGLSPFTYQWYQIPSGGTTGVAISGATSPSYSTPSVDLTYNGDQYYATVTDSCAGTPLDSTAATLTVTAGNTSPTIVVQPVGVNVTAGGTTSFSVTATGTPALSYQWYRIPAGQTTGILIGGATSATYNVPASATTPANDQDAYYVIVSNSVRASRLPERNSGGRQWHSASDHRPAGHAIRGRRGNGDVPSHRDFHSSADLSVV